MSRAGAIGGADLGGSSKHSSEALEGRSGAGLHTNVDRLWPSRARGQGEGIETRRGRQRVRGRPKGNRASIPEPRRGDLPGRAYAPRFARRLARRRAGAVRPGQAATQTPSETTNRDPGKSYLFLVRSPDERRPPNRFDRRRGGRRGRKATSFWTPSGAFRSSLENPSKRRTISREHVPNDRIRSPRREASGRYRAMQTREVGKTDPYLRNKDWLSRWASHEEPRPLRSCAAADAARRPPLVGGPIAARRPARGQGARRKCGQNALNRELKTDKRNPTV